MSYSACEEHGHLLPFSKICSGFPQWSSVNGQTSAKWLFLVPFIVSTALEYSNYFQDKLPSYFYVSFR